MTFRAAMFVNYADITAYLQMGWIAVRDHDYAYGIVMLWLCDCSRRFLSEASKLFPPPSRVPAAASPRRRRRREIADLRGHIASSRPCRHNQQPEDRKRETNADDWIATLHFHATFNFAAALSALKNAPTSSQAAAQ